MAEQMKNFLGFDLSTQQVKAVVINDNLEVTHEAVVNFDLELPEYRTHGGVRIHEDQVTVTAPTLMWVKAFDLILDKLKLDGVDFSTIVALSGAAQQHGSVFWKKGSRDILRSLNADKFLYEQLQTCFAVRDSPVWQDSSTSSQCHMLEQKVGGPEKLAAITGSRAYERFTGPQIAKLFQTRPEAYNNTERISLISSFMSSVFLGDFAPIDDSDGSGMNLLDIRSKDWSDVCIEACAPNLREKLGAVVPSCTNLGLIASYFVERYGFPHDCAVIAFTGDNPEPTPEECPSTSKPEKRKICAFCPNKLKRMTRYCCKCCSWAIYGEHHGEMCRDGEMASLAGMNLQPGDIAISLGTSDTVFLWLTQVNPSLEGHVLCNPVDTSSYMALICFKNGSLTRERIRDSCADGSWALFEELLKATPCGNFDNIGMYFDMKEITPPVIGDHRFFKTQKVARFSNEVEVRAVIEGQFIAKRVHAENLGYSLTETTRVLATGGASINKEILQVLADVFNAPVYIQDVANSACLGSAYRAKHGLIGDNTRPFHQVVNILSEFKMAVKPHTDALKIYNPLVTRYRKLEELIVSEQRNL